MSSEGNMHLLLHKKLHTDMYIYMHTEVVHHQWWRSEIFRMYTFGTYSYMTAQFSNTVYYEGGLRRVALQAKPFPEEAIQSNGKLRKWKQELIDRNWIKQHHLPSLFFILMIKGSIRSGCWLEKLTYRK